MNHEARTSTNMFWWQLIIVQLHRVVQSHDCRGDPTILSTSETSQGPNSLGPSWLETCNQSWYLHVLIHRTLDLTPRENQSNTAYVIFWTFASGHFWTAVSTCDLLVWVLPRLALLRVQKIFSSLICLIQGSLHVVKITPRISNKMANSFSPLLSWTVLYLLEQFLGLNCTNI